MVCTMPQNGERYERIHTTLLSLLVTKLYYCEPFQITANRLEFWTTDQVQLDQLKLEVEEGLYPPRFQIAAGGDVTESVLAKITFKSESLLHSGCSFQAGTRNSIFIRYCHT